MTDQELEQRLRSWYRTEVPDFETAPMALRVRVQAIPGSSVRSWRAFWPPRGFAMVAAAALLSVALVGGALLVGDRLVRPPSVAPTPPTAVTPTADPTTPSLQPTVSPSPDGLLGGGWIIAYDPELQDDTVRAYLVDAGSGDRTPLGTLPSPGQINFDEWIFQWAADRTHVLVSEGMASQRTATLNSPTEAGRALTLICCLPPNDGWGPPALSPDGSMIAVGGGVFTGDLADAAFTALPLPEGAERSETARVHGDVSWAPDGSAIVVSGCRPCEPEMHGRLFIQPIDGSAVRELLDITEGHFGAPAWSPSGSTIAIAHGYCDPPESSPECGPDLFSVDTVPAGGGELTTIVSATSGWPGVPVWSPNGLRIAVIRGVADGGGILVMDPDGGNQVVLGSGEMEHIGTNLPGPKWSPDGQWLLFVKDGDLWVVGADGNGERNLGALRGADW